MNKTIIGIVLGILVLGGLVWVARPTTPENSAPSVKSNGVLVAMEAGNYDFGSISMAAGNVKHTFKIKNTGNEEVAIDKMYTSCMCTTAVLQISGRQFGPYGMPGHGAIPKIDQTITPGEEAGVEVIFDPAAHGPAGIGQIQRTVTIENNVGQPVLLQFSANVTP